MKEDSIKKKSLLILTFVVPYPANDGGKIYCYGYVDQLRHYLDITLVIKVNTEDEMLRVEKLKKLWPNVTIQTVRMPAKKPLDHKIKALDFVKRLIGYREEDYMDRDREKAMQSIEWAVSHRVYVQAVQEILSGSFFDIVQVEHASNLGLISLLPKASKKVYVEIESMHLIKQDELNTSSPVKTTFDHYLIDHTRRLEYAFMQDYDAVFTLNTNDYHRISSTLDTARCKVFLSPYGTLQKLNVSEQDIATYQPAQLIFMGSEFHGPNPDAVRWFAQEILPELQKNNVSLPLRITGYWTDSFKQSLSHLPSIQFCGFVDDLSAVAKNSIMVVPIRLGGGGMRAKVLDGLSLGCPIVSTTLGCEGFEQASGAIEKADSAEAFAAKISLLVNDEKLCQEMVKNGTRAVQDFFNFEMLAQQRLEYYNEL